MDVPTAAVVLAAGEGRRMVSDLPQVLHKVADLPLVCHTMRMVLARSWAPVVVVVSPQTHAPVKEALESKFHSASITYKEQVEPLGTLDAADQGLQALGDFEGNVIVLPGNMPLLQSDTTLLCLEAMIAEGTGGAQAPYVGLVQRGVVRHLPVFCAEKQWLQLAIRAAAGTLAGSGDSSAATWIRELQDTMPASGAEDEGDALAKFAAKGFAVNAASEDDLCIVTSRQELAVAERLLRARIIAQHQAQGVTFKDPDGTFVGANVQIGKDSTIGVGVQLYGSTTLGKSVRVDGPTVITDSAVEQGGYIRAFSVLEGAHVGERSGAGPFARLREGTIMAPESYVGNFVETKNASLGRNTLACHLTYLGDAEVGSRTNIGAGTITCNFDGVAKNRTTIGSGAFIGSNSTLVAPATVGDGALVAAGSVITSEVSPGAAAFGRARQTSKEEYADVLRAKTRERHVSK